ncbi:S1C family serine protease [Nocardia callitridis]|uniref:PDZ domain-containing protein n=1 Tax=Nocardia callitridis TaxID=648753 RepID=A0ABP9KKK1_9NOCA
MSAPIVVTAVIAGLIGGGVGVGGSALLLNQHSSPPALTTQTSPNEVDEKPGSVTYAAQTAMKSTVDIKVADQQGVMAGSGIVLSQDGYVLTNHHVVSSALGGGKISVELPGGDTESATITGTSPSYDLAVIKVDGVTDLTPAVLGESSSLKVGQQVAAVGSPEELSNTVTAGIVSALSRTVTAADESGGQALVYNGLQTDAPINPGNSGGPLVNLNGQVVAVNSAAETGQSAEGGVQSFGLGFSIPIDTAKRVADQLLHDHTATKPVLGVSGTLTDPHQPTAGAAVADVQPDGPADKGGLRAGDTVTHIGQVPVNSYADLMAQTLTHVPGDKVDLTVAQPNGTTHTVTVTLGSAPDTQQTTIKPSPFGRFGGH